METYLVYIGKSAIAAGAFYIAFLLLFQNQKHFTFNRIYLPVSLALSFVIPLITFTTIKYIEPVNFDVNSFAYLAPASGEIVQPAFVFEWYHYLFGLYLLGAVGFLFHLLLGHLKAINIIQKSRIQKIFDNQVNITPKDVHPFSFFSKIVVSEKTLSHPDLEIIVSHENIHVREKHTFDILFTEIMFLLQWFNPFAWLLKDAVKNNLEYLTDHEIAKHYNPQTYQLAMVTLADKQGIAPFLTALNGSQLKNRIVMMKKKTENKYAFVKQLAVLPLLAILVMGLSNKEVKPEVLKSDLESKFQTPSEQSDINFMSAVDTVSKPKEIVVVGSGTQKTESKAEGGYSISGGMNGKMQKGSENVTITSSTPNGITIRGTSGLNGQPLYIVDGVEVKSVEMLSPAGIEKIEILKDQTSTILYGDKGKNGVILITTKKGISSAKSDDIVVTGYATKFKNQKNDVTLKSTDGSTSHPIVIVDGQEYKSMEDANVPIEEIASISVLKGESASPKIYGERAKDGVIVISTKTKYNSEKPELKSEKQTMLDLRKKIAWAIKYPVTAQENNQQGVVEMWAYIQKDGTISSVTDKKPDGKFINVDEVVVTGLKSEKTVTSEKSKDLSLLVKESKRVIEQLSPLTIPELAGEMVCFRIKFVLE
ncbi:MAG TPA: hypothetical protein DER09_07670 [Prolixibacteraceae bacterium]|nr:hypothetical protein [Prolixibacteraceae bacterium]